MDLGCLLELEQELYDDLEEANYQVGLFMEEPVGFFGSRKHKKLGCSLLEDITYNIMEFEEAVFPPKSEESAFPVLTKFLVVAEDYAQTYASMASLVSLTMDFVSEDSRIFKTSKSKKEATTFFIRACEERKRLTSALMKLETSRNAFIESCMNRFRAAIPERCSGLGS